MCWFNSNDFHHLFLGFMCAFCSLSSSSSVSTLVHSLPIPAARSHFTLVFVTFSCYANPSTAFLFHLPHFEMWTERNLSRYFIKPKPWCTIAFVFFFLSPSKSEQLNCARAKCEWQRTKNGEKWKSANQTDAEKRKKHIEQQQQQQRRKQQSAVASLKPYHI